MSDFLDDVKQGVRALRSGRRRTYVAVSCIALGLGATVFIVTIAHSILLRPPALPAADRLVRVWLINQANRQRQDISFVEATELMARTRSFDAFEAAVRTRLALFAGAGTERVRGESVTGGYFDLIGVNATVGRVFTADDHAANAAPVIVISDALWRRKFGARSDIIGQTVHARGSTGPDTDQLFTVIGVLPSGFVGTVDPDVSDFWLPTAQYRPRRIIESPAARSTWVLARLRPGATIADAQAEVNALNAEFARERPQLYDQLQLHVEPFGESWRGRFRAGLFMLTTAAALLLLIAATNVANVQLARILERQPELVMRGVLGASRARLLRQLLIENLVLAVIGGTAGLALGGGAVRLFARAQLFALPNYVAMTVSPMVIIISFALLAGTALLFGALPAWRGSSAAAAQDLRASGRGTTSSRRESSLMHALVAAQVALAFLLLTGSILMLRTYHNLLRSNLGYRSDNILRMAVSLDSGRFPDSLTQLRFATDLRDLLRQQPGVRSATVMAGVLPPFFDRESTIAVDGVVVNALRSVQTHAVDDAFFSVLQIELMHGRLLSTVDRTGSHRVAVISEALARAISTDDPQHAVGATIQLNPAPGAAAREVEIVGIVENIKYHGPLSSRAADYDLYLPLAHAAGNVLSIAVRTDGDAAAFIDPLQRVIGNLAPTSPQHWISTMRDELHRQYAESRLYAWLTGCFGFSALALVLLGIYGVVNKSVSRRLPELGIRMAIGARPTRVIALVVSDTLRSILLGLAIGLAATLASSHILTSLVYGVAATDTATYALVIILLLAAGISASALPAWRAAQAGVVRALAAGR